MNERESTNIFEDLFVLEIANNHWGDVERGKAIIEEYGKIVRCHRVKAAIKLQFRDVPNFVHSDFKGREDVRYIWKTEKTQLEKEQHAVLVQTIRETGCIPMATPFDERAVAWCAELGIDIIKVASSDINDWFLLQEIANTEKPVILSTGGATLESIDKVVNFFGDKKIPIALNHCISNYPSEDSELELHQIDFLRERYPGVVIGLSTHEYSDWTASMMISYAKGARTWERHVDIEYPEGDERQVSKYCSLPHQAHEWFTAYHKAREMCGCISNARRIVSEKERTYLDALVRGVYFKTNLPVGHTITMDDVYLAIPLQEGQFSPCDVIEGKKLLRQCDKDKPMLCQDVVDE